MTCALATVAIATALVAGPQCPRADRAVPGDVMAALIGAPVATRDDADFAAAARAVRATPNRRAAR